MQQHLGGGETDSMPGGLQLVGRARLCSHTVRLTSLLVQCTCVQFVQHAGGLTKGAAGL